MKRPMTDPLDEGFNEEPTDAYLKRVQAAFEPGGALTGATEHFARREGQMKFALDVARSIMTHGTDIIEAGTGTGKTFAYLTPAVLAGCKVVVSTAGKPLQDQLFTKDLPAVLEALGTNADIAVLKGRANYVCKYRLAVAMSEGRLPSPEAAKDLRRIAEFAQIDPVGDRAACHGVPEDSPAWPFATSSAENCLGNKCPHFTECFVNQARSRAKNADIAVVNHHLYLSAMALMAEAEGAGDDARMLPKADVVIFDEAHKLPEVASAFFGSEFSTYVVKNAVKELKVALMGRYRRLCDANHWDTKADAVVYRLMDFVMRLSEIGMTEGMNKRIADIDRIETTAEMLNEAENAAAGLSEELTDVIEDDPEVEKGATLLADAAVAMSEWVDALKHPKAVVKNGADIPVVRWVERTRTEARLNETPLSFADDFAKLRESQSDAAWIFTSATLATGKADFSHFIKEMGMEGAETHVYDSPFEYPEQAMLYVPGRMPDARTTEREAYIDALIEESWPVIDLVGGRTFLLCTSYRAMQQAAMRLRERIDANNRSYEVLLQNEDSRTKLIERFRTSTRGAILVGSMSFWEGIDIKGEALSLVVIDKLPFAPKDDPVLEAKGEWIREQGGNPFSDHQIPLAAITLKQGTGRLIRSEKDRGILIIGDKRVLPNVTRYAAQFLGSLPPFSRTLKLERVLDFWQHPESWQ